MDGLGSSALQSFKDPDSFQVMAHDVSGAAVLPMAQPGSPQHPTSRPPKGDEKVNGGKVIPLRK